MNQKLTPSTVLMLSLPPLLWAGNAIVGRAINDQVPPITLNFLRWVIAMMVLLPLGYSIFRRDSSLWTHWRRYSLLGLLSVGLYNALQYLALQSSTPINVTLVASSMPFWMLLVGRMFFSATISGKQVIGAVLSLAGVVLVLSRGDLTQLLGLRFVIGDFYIILAVIAWSFYSWLLIQGKEPDDMRKNWATFLLAQVSFGVVWSGAFAAAEWALIDWKISWSWPLVAALTYVAIGPAIVALRCWGVGVQRVGPNTAGFFNNLTPLFAALLSTIFLGETPRIYHAIAFVLIVCGIVFSSDRQTT
ncbi:MAG TPA: DMT family transporter [Eoetvoesiella sp.]